ncbi:papain-like cysteine protease family protein [Anaerocellum diazotrophicum]|uniref:Peptidase C39-like domain-containing protein n=1 Tax=Caldicellulosiruptor diazotrophicus TaxID=2806205 RepID=A0ABM7NJZ9_9FIRM|nr:papain-like cysteine protease family protein [Caldicellulosiruptor diazotrophicus]BCS80435.1 hypothetical protein CaldiYA01_03950 [Caldicellulosiruptor diazotrophicus]
MVKKLLKKGRYKRIVISAIVFFTLLLLNLSDAFAENTVTYVELPVKKVSQAYSNWCWAAGCESILYYCKNYLGFGREATQWDIVKYIYGSYVNKTGGFSDIQRALNYYGVGYSEIKPVSGWTISYDQIIQQVVTYRRPIGGHFYVKGAHFAVICGIWQYFDVNAYMQNYVVIMDPDIGGLRFISDLELRDGDSEWELNNAARVYRAI